MNGKCLLVYWVTGLLVLCGSVQCFGQDTSNINQDSLISLYARSPIIYDTILVNGKKVVANLGLRIKLPINYNTLANFDFENQLKLDFKNDTGKTKIDSTAFFLGPLHVKNTLLTEQEKKKRIRFITATNLVGYGGAMVGLYSAWYKDYPQTHFHFFNDNHEWLQVDKVGHAWSAYMEGRTAIELWRWTGISRKKQVWIGGLSGAAYQTVIEVLDGFCAEWGWSWGDITANTIGSSILIGQELLWNEQRIQFKWSFNKRNYKDPVLRERADSVYGKDFLSRMLKDYNAQTYWLSANLKSFFPKSNLPAWLNVAVGYGADGMFGAEENKWKDKQGNTVTRYDVDRYRQWYLAPDIDLTKIKTKSKFLKNAFFVLNLFKFPTPSLGFSKKGVEINWLHF